MDEAGRVVFLALLSGVGLTGLFLATGALFPTVVKHARQSAEVSPGRSLLVGLVNFVFLGALGLGFSALAENSGVGFFQLIAVILFSILAILMGYGLTGLSQLTGARLLPSSHSVWQQVLGSWTLILGGLTPFIGWFALFPYVALVSIGSVMLGWVRARREKKVTVQDPPQAQAAQEG